MPWFMLAQRRPVTNEPQVAEWVDEPALAMSAPGHLMVVDRVDAAICSCRHCALDEGVRVLDEDLDPHRPRAEGTRRVPAIAFWFAQEERCAQHGKPHDITEIPQLDGPHRLGVPPGGCRSVRYGHHE